MLVGGCSVVVSRGDQFNGVLKVPRGQMRVPGGHLNRLVSHEFLAGFQWDACHYQAAAKCMPQTMLAKILNLRFHQTTHLRRGSLERSLKLNCAKQCIAAGQKAVPRFKFGRPSESRLGISCFRRASVWTSEWRFRHPRRAH